MLEESNSTDRADAVYSMYSTFQDDGQLTASIDGKGKEKLRVFSYPEGKQVKKWMIDLAVASRHFDLT